MARFKKGELNGDGAEAERAAPEEAREEERSEAPPSGESEIPSAKTLLPMPPSSFLKRTLVWIDEAGFYLLPMAVRTWAPIGVTPVLEETFGRDHLSVIAGLTLEGGLIARIQEKAFDGAAVVRFLGQILRQINGLVTVIWDGATIHRSKEVKAFLTDGAAKRLHLEILPAYSPDLNGAERVWQALKCVELRNLCCLGLAELRLELRKAIERLRRKVDLLKGFACHLDSS